MRPTLRLVVALPIAALGLACVAPTDASAPEGDDDVVATESTAEAVSVTSTPGKAVWTKVYRSYSTSAQTIASDVAVDGNGASYVGRTKQQPNDLDYRASSVDVTRYSATGSLVWRVDPGGHDTILGGALHVAARGGRVISIAMQSYGARSGTRGLVTVMNAADGAIRARLRLEAQPSTWTSGSTTYSIDGQVEPSSIAAFDDGGFVLVARVRGDADFGTGTLPDHDPTALDTVVARFNRDGVAIAARRFEDTRGTFVGVDSSDNVYLSTKGSLIDPTVVAAAVHKLSSSLDPVRSTYFGPDADIDAMNVSRGGRVAIGGIFYGTARFGGTTLSETFPSKHGDSFVAKLDPSGGVQYAMKLQGESMVRVMGVAIDSYGQVVAALNPSGALTIDGTRYPYPMYEHQIALLKIAATSPTARWLKFYRATDSADTSRPSPTRYAHALSVAIGGGDRILMTGTFATDIDFGRGVIHGEPTGNSFFTRFYQ